MAALSANWPKARIGEPAYVVHPEGKASKCQNTVLISSQSVVNISNGEVDGYRQQ